MFSSLSQKMQLNPVQKLRLPLHHKLSHSPNLICKHKKIQVHITNRAE